MDRVELSREVRISDTIQGESVTVYAPTKIEAREKLAVARLRILLDLPRTAAPVTILEAAAAYIVADCS